MKILSEYIKRNACVSRSASKFDYTEYLKHNLGYTRDKMPQIFKENFDSTIKSIQDFGLERMEIPLKEIKATQCEVNVDKIKRKMLDDKFKVSDQKFIISKTNHLVDGHHSHVAGLINEPESLVTVYKSRLGTKELIEIINNLKHTTNNEV